MGERAAKTKTIKGNRGIFSISCGASCHYPTVAASLKSANFPSQSSDGFRIRRLQLPLGMGQHIARGSDHQNHGRYVGPFPMATVAQPSQGHTAFHLNLGHVPGVSLHVRPAGTLNGTRCSKLQGFSPRKYACPRLLPARHGGVASQFRPN